MLPKSLLLGMPARPGRGKADRPLRNLLKALPRDWNVELVDAARGRFLKAMEKAASARDFGAILVLDDPRTRIAIRGLAGRSASPRVLVQFGDPQLGLTGLEPPEDHGGAMLAGRHPLRGPHEVWRLSPEPPRLHLDGHLPDRFLQHPSIEPAWVRAQLDRCRTGKASRPKTRGKVSIVVPVWNNLKYTKPCLESVLRWTSDPFELLVVDNASTDGTPAYLRRLAKKHSNVKVITNRKNLGFPGGVNRGMRAARGKYVAWLNNDTLVSPGWIDHLVSCVERAPWIGAAGPVTNNANGMQNKVSGSSYSTKNFSLFAQAWSLAHARKSSPAHRLVGFCTLIRSEAVDRVGLLDERFGKGCYEDFDYSLRLRQAGYELAVAEDVVIHHHSHKSFQKLAPDEDRAARNREIFIDKWCRKSLDFLDSIDPLLSTRR